MTTVTSNNEIIAFGDGILNAYSIDKYGKKNKCVVSNCRFSYRTIGAQRYYAASSANIRITDMIAIPAGIHLRESDIIVINNCDYTIQQIQTIFDGKPKHKLISLNRNDRYE